MEREFHSETKSRVRRGLLAFLGVLFAFRLAYMGLYQLIPDEAYYWSWTKRLAFCYFDQPGMVAWVGRLFTGVFGDGVWGVRLAAWALTAVSSYLLYRISLALMEDRTWALAAVVLVNLLPIYSAGALIYIHDTCLMFFWTITCAVLVRIARGGEGGTWIALAFSMLFALYSKFSAVLGFPCIALFLVLSRQHRFWLRRHEPYLAAAVIAVLFVPVIAWNMQHEWVAYHAVNKLAHPRSFGITERLLSVLDYAGGQLLVFSPVVFVLGVLAMERGLRVGWRKQESVRLALACASGPIFAYFLYVSLRTKVQANWPMMGFVGGSVLAVDLVRRRWDGPRRRFWRGLAAAGVGMALVFFALIHIHPLVRVLPFLEGRDITDQIYGWEELARRVDAELERSGRDRTVVMGRSYQVASELEFYLPGEPRVYCANFAGRGNQYDVWQDFRTIEGFDVILVDGRPDLSGRFKRHFAACHELEPFHVLREGRVVRTYYLYRLQFFMVRGPFRSYFADPLDTSVRRMRDRRLRAEGTP